MTTMWIADADREALRLAGLATFDQVMAATAGRCARVLSDRENWYLPAAVENKAHSVLSTQYSVLSARVVADPDTPAIAQFANLTPPPGLYLKKHRGRNWRTRLAAALGLSPPASPGRIEAENALALTSLGIEVMPLTAYGEKLHADGRLESFLLSEELQGYCELQDFIVQRSSPVGNGLRAVPPGSPIPARKECHGGHSLQKSPAAFDLRRLIAQVADIARRFHAAGFNHRDFYTCHFLVKEASPGRFDVRLIDLQRVQRRRWFRRRWIVKDLAQLASMSPEEQIGCREKVLFLRTYLGVKKLRPQDKQLVRAVLRKLASIRRHTNPKRQRGDTNPKRQRGDTNPKRQRGDTNPKRQRGDTNPKRQRGDTNPKRQRGSKTA